MSAAGDSPSSDDDDFNFDSHVGSKRYPLHDCCEFEDAESLRRLIFIRQDVSDGEASSSSSVSSTGGDDDSSSSDDNDSHAAAHAAAIGHSPQPIPGHVPTGDATEAAASGSKANEAGETPMSVDQEHVESDVSTHLAPANDDAVNQSTSSQQHPQTSVGKNDPDAVDKKKLSDTTDTVKGISPSSDEGDSAPGTSADDAGIVALKPMSVSLTATATSTQGPGEEHADTTTVNESVVPQHHTAVAMDISPEVTVHDDRPAEREQVTTDQKGETQAENGATNHKAPKKNKKKTPTEPKAPTYYCPYDLNERDEDENTPLHVAIHARKLEHVKLLLEAGASVHRKCDGSAPIHTAISMGSIPLHTVFAYECTIVLLSHGADVSVRDDTMHTPLYLACMMNLPQIVRYILNQTPDSTGISTLNLKGDRSGGRPLHAAAKYDTPAQPNFRNPASARAPVAHHHPDGTISHSHHHLPGIHRGQPGSAGYDSTKPNGEGKSSETTDTTALVTQVLLSTPGIEVDARNTYGQTPLHVACSRGNWPVVRLLLRSGANPHVADRRGFSPGQLAHKRGMPIPNNLLPVLGEASSSCHGAPPRDLIVDPDSTTLFMCHELCSLHRSCAPIRRDTSSDPPPENVRRLHVLINEVDGILRAGEFGRCRWEGNARRAAMGDILKVHEYNYVESISQMCLAIPDHPSAIAHLDADTAVSRWSFEAALRAAGSVCQAVDRVIAGEARNAFCAVRPPGHHAGPRGIVRCANDPEGGSHGFCLLNNVCIGAAYARSMYRNDGIKKIAIIDFDVHHGNGTEEVVRQLVPTVETSLVRTPFAIGELAASNYRPWLDETDVQDVFFASTHGYGPRTIEFSDHPQQSGWFYPASGKSQTTDAIKNPSLVESPNLADFLLSQTWTRIGEESRMNCCKVINCGMALPAPDDIPGMQRVELRDAYRKKILPRLREFEPDIIFISAGFDAHRRDNMNFGYVGMVEEDYEWVTEQLVKVANTFCNGRIISVLEGGYKIQGGIVSPFARSVASHVRALVDGGRSRELYDPAEGEWDSQYERHMVEERERKRKQKQERLNRAAEESRREFYAKEEEHAADDAHDHDVDALMKEPLNEHHPAGENHHDGPSEQPPRKRRRNQVDYKELYEKMKREGGFAG